MTPQEQNIVSNLVVQSMTNAMVRNELIANPTQYLEQNGVNLGQSPPALTAVADTETLFNVIVPVTPLGPTQTLPQLPLPNPTPFCIMVWIMTNVQAGGSLANQLLQNPVGVLTSMGVHLPQGIQIKVWQETQNQRYIGLPYYGSGSAIPVQFVSVAAKGKHPTPPPVNNNINVNVNANVDINAVAVVNAAAVTNVEAAINASSAVVAAEVIAVLVI
ncbi:MAG: nitrile hydratase subunit alpha [Acidobacteriaceae bacterium]|nr:nitrile hydratase subunit alpha [Acidobacteriaceae bacterium]